MPTVSELAELFNSKSSVELNAMFHHPDDWTEEALTAAKDELERRNQPIPESIAHPLPKPSIGKKNKNISKSIKYGLIYGSLFVLFGMWLYSGSTKGDFSCSVSIIPCPAVGIICIIIGIGLVIAGLRGKLEI